MEDYAALLTARTAMRASAVPLTDTRPNMIAARIAELPERLAAVLLVGLPALESAAVQSITAANAGRSVISETDVFTATVAAAAVMALRGKGIRPRTGRLAVIVAERAPRLRTVLLECGAATVTEWDGHTTFGPKVRRLMVDHDIVIDLTGQDSIWAVPSRTVSAPADPYRFAALAVPGVLSALCGHGAAWVSIDALAAAARALALITPVGCALPDPRDPRLVPAVARHVSRILSASAPQRPRTHS